MDYTSLYGYVRNRNSTAESRLIGRFFVASTISALHPAKPSSPAYSDKKVRASKITHGCREARYLQSIEKNNNPLTLSYHKIYLYNFS